MNMKANWKTILSRCVLFVITAATAIPLLWLVVLSFKSDTDILNNPFSLPEHIDLANYRRALDTLPLFKMFGNTLIVAVFALLISLVCTFMISYAITRLHFDHAKNYSFTEGELHKMKEAGIQISFDFSDDSTEEYYRKTAPDVTYAFCSFDGTDQETEEHLKKIISMGPRLAMASRGAKGCILYDGEKFFVQPAMPLKEVKDTLGAGDSMIASFLTVYTGRIKNGFDQDVAIRESLKEAAAFAAGICGIEGAFGCGKKYE